jgi:lysophospholipase L1-like esterase
MVNPSEQSDSCERSVRMSARSLRKHPHGYAMRVVCMAAALFLIVLSVLGQSESWVGTWAMSPMRGDAGTGLAGRTLRQIVHTSVAGDQLRVRLSNLYGEHPLHIEDVHVALRTSGSSVAAGSDRELLFGARTSIVIAPGSSALSDALAFPVPALSDLVVSFYLPDPAGSTTFHPSAHQTNYIAEGNVSAQTDLPEQQPTGSIYFLTNVDVRGQGVSGAVVTLGASITEGYAATDNTPNRWPDVLAQRLVQAGIHIGVLNEGISGNRLLVEGAGPNAEERFVRDVLDQPGVRWVIFSDDPINDLGSTRPAPSAEALVRATRRLIAKAHAKRIRFYCSTLTPYQGANYWRPEDEVARDQYNDFVRSGKSGCDGVIDQDRATHDPAKPARFLAADDSGDHLHPNDAGHKAIADAVDLSLFSKPLKDTAGK